MAQQNNLNKRFIELPLALVTLTIDTNGLFRFFLISSHKQWSDFKVIVRVLQGNDAVCPLKKYIYLLITISPSDAIEKITLKVKIT